MTVLMITKSNDNAAVDLVTQAIQAQGGQLFRLNTDCFPTEVQLAIRQEGQVETYALEQADHQLNLDSVTAVWYRRVAYGAKLPQQMDAQLRRASILESRTMMQGLIASLDAFHLDPLSAVRYAEHKQLQLKLASKVGLSIPRTLITNQPAAVRDFARSCPEGIVTKMMSAFAIYDQQNSEQVVFTNPVTAADLEQLEGLSFCPMTFQACIPKALELRTTIVGQQVFTAAIDSQTSQRAIYDWRREGAAFVNAWQPYELPQEVTAKLLQLMKCLHLNYGAIDLILTPDQQYVFLEVNPVGEFCWLEQCAGLPISRAIASLLLQKG